VTAIKQAKEALALCHARFESPDDYEHDVKIIAAVILAEREACARISEDGYDMTVPSGLPIAIAAAIRARP